MPGLETDQHVATIFQGFRRANANLSFPGPGTLSKKLNAIADSARAAQIEAVQVEQEVVRLFASAAVEMWHRALHSFIVSAALTETSSLWSSVAGYYASHYAVRGCAHLLGRYLLYRHKRVAVLHLDHGRYYCSLDRKGGSDREHKAYWRFVRESDQFGKDPLFSVDADASPKSDGAHRNLANYSDHIARYPSFAALTLEAAVERIQRISEIELTAVPIPNAERYPDLTNVQIIAYHRIVRFRRYLDSLLGGQNRFWNAHREPSWCRSIVDYQVVEPQFLPDSIQ